MRLGPAGEDAYPTKISVNRGLWIGEFGMRNVENGRGYKDAENWGVAGATPYRRSSFVFLCRARNP